MKNQMMRQFLGMLGILLIAFSCQNRKVNPLDPEPLGKVLPGYQIARVRRTITGLVMDRSTELAIPDVMVTVIDTTGGLDSTIAVGTTNLSGRFDIPGIPNDTLLVYFSKDGYIDATITAYVQYSYWSVDLKTTALIPLGMKAVIGSAGGSLTDTDEEGDIIRLDIPAGALNSDVEITITHLQGVDVPFYPPEGRLSYATAHFGPEGTLFQKPVMITMPLPQVMTPGVELPLYSYGGILRVKWEDTGIQAKVDDDGLTATAQVDHFSVYSLMPEVQVIDAAVDTLWEQYELLPSAYGAFTVTYEDRPDNLGPEFVEFPNGTDGLNRSTLIYMFEQYYGVSFNASRIETIYYQSTRGLYPFRVIRGIIFTGEMILQDPLRTVYAIKCIKRPMVVYTAHDQGCVN
ncbi:hypothetical protein JW906_07515 [bacterium]|nr:hypothetical protein [bacterium]